MPGPAGNVRAEDAADGLDPTFGTGGKVTIPDGAARDIAIQGNGKIVVAGDANCTFTVIRLNSDGSLDTGFGTGGRATARFMENYCERAYAVAVQADGKIVAAGSGGSPDHMMSSAFALVRFNADGSLDTSFGTGGMVLEDFDDWGSDQINDVAVQADGRIVVVGRREGSSDGPWGILRYEADGDLDSTFGSAGMAASPFPDGDAAAVAIQANGRVVVAGGTSGRFGVARLTTGGSLDTTFDGDGLATTTFDGGSTWPRAMALQADGRIVVSGVQSGYDQQLALARFTTDGNLDTGFSGDGRVTSTDVEYGSGLGLQADGGIIVAGYTWRATADFSVLRFDPDGRLDARTMTDFGGSEEASAVAIQADGRIVVAGSGAGWTLARYTAIPSIKELVASPTAVDFGSAYVGSPAAQETVKVTNPSSSTDVMVGTVELTGAAGTGISIATEDCAAATLAPKASCDVDVEFAPAATGAVGASLHVSSDAEASPLVVQLEGTGVDPISLDPSFLAFGLAYEDTADTPLATTLVNDGEVAVTVTSVVISGDQDFTIEDETCTDAPVPAHGSCAVTVGFTPGSPGARVATLTISGPSPLDARSVLLLGTGLLASPSLPALVAGERVTCAIREDRTLACWGDTEEGQTAPPPGEFLAVSLGWPYACGIRADETLACWSNRDEPGDALPDGTFTAIDAGHGQYCAIRTDGRLACWRGAGADMPTGRFMDVAAGWHHACAVKVDGNVTCWGYDAFGQASPPSGSFIDVGAGAYFSCGLRSNGTLACWGAKDYGATSPPTGTFTALSIGSFGGCATRTNGTLACWGNNSSGQAWVPSGTFLAVSAGTSHTCAIRSDGAVGCWGSNDYGESSLLPTTWIKTLPARVATTSLPLQWWAAPTLSPIASYDVRYRRAKWNGGFGARTTWRAATTVTSATFPASPGYTYCFSVRARDTDGYTSGWTGETCTAVPLDDRAFTRSGRWAARTGSAYYRSTFLRSSTAGAKLTRTGVVAKRITLVATTCPTCGTVKVYWGSTLLKKISLRSSTTVNKKLISVKTFTSVKKGTLKIVVVSSGKKVIIDGVAIRRN